jgi:hypothetical protein
VKIGRFYATREPVTQSNIAEFSDGPDQGVRRIELRWKVLVRVLLYGQIRHRRSGLDEVLDLQQRNPMAIFYMELRHAADAV